ncbi:hypothetical protein ACVWWN_000108 [Mycobacterium sp. URHB0021]
MMDRHLSSNTWQDLVNGPGEEVDLRGWQRCWACSKLAAAVLLVIKPLSAKLSIVGSLPAIVLVVSTAPFSSSLQV